MKMQIGNVMSQLLLTNPYKKINIIQICDEAHISRRTFYNHFYSKDHLAEYMVERDFMDHAFPLFSYHLGRAGCQSFFAYIKKNEILYTRLLEYDEGILLMKYLENAYNKASDLVEVFSIPAVSHQKKINPMVYRLYANNGIAAVVVYWIKGGMKIAVEDISRDLYLMIEEPLSYVRDHCL